MGDRTLSVNVLIDESYLVDHPEVVDNLRDAGLRIDRILSSAGVVIGELDSDGMERIRDVPGVLEVETTRPVRAI